MKQLKFTWPCIMAMLLFVSGCRDKEQLPELEFSETSIEVPAQGGEVSIAYELFNPSSTAVFSAETDDDWIDDTSFDFEEAGVMKFTVFENTGADAREGFVTVTYANLQERLRIVQAGTSEDPLPEQDLVMEILNVDESSVTCRITPVDDNLTYACMAVLRSEYEEYAGSNPETFYTLMVDNYELFAEQEGMTLEDFLNTYILMTGVQEFTISDMTFDTEYLLFYVGMDDQGNRLTDIFYESVTTENIEMLDVTFEIEYEQDYADLLMKVTPSDNTVPYFYHIVTQDELDASGLTIKEWFQKEINTTITFLQYFYGLEDMREILEDYIGVSFGPDEYLYTEHEDEGWDESLWLGKDYVGAAFTLDWDGNINSEVTHKSFTTQDADPSDNRLTITVDAVNLDYANYTVAATNDDPWLSVVGLASDYEGKSDEEIISSLEYAYESSSAHKGSLSRTAYYLYPETEYAVLAFGYDHGMVTTPLVKEKFTTLAPGNPEDLVFDFSVEFGPNERNPDAMVANVTVTGTPVTALFWTDFFYENATEDDVLARIEEGVKMYEDFGMSRVDYFIGMGERGSFTYPYPVDPGTRFKMAAVGIYEETGELATDIVFSEVYEAPADGEYTCSPVPLPYGRPVAKPSSRDASPAVPDYVISRTDDSGTPGLLKRSSMSVKQKESVKTGAKIRMILPER